MSIASRVGRAGRLISAAALTLAVALAGFGLAAFGLAGGSASPRATKAITVPIPKRGQKLSIMAEWTSTSGAVPDARGIAHLELTKNGPGTLNAIVVGVPDGQYGLALSRQPCSALVGNPAPPLRPVYVAGANGGVWRTTNVAVSAPPRFARARSMVLARPGANGIIIVVCARVQRLTDFGPTGSINVGLKSSLAAAAAPRDGSRRAILIASLIGGPSNNTFGLVDLKARVKPRRGPDMIKINRVTGVLTGLMPNETVDLATSRRSCAASQLRGEEWRDSGLDFLADANGNAFTDTIFDDQAERPALRSAAVFRPAGGVWLACGPLGFWVVDNEPASAK